ncbi:MarR family winged helix-turn-helix transcriptional regulator [Hyalangium rubrum]|uniref:MarR family transcriptional regulator n=1 Tax=Hyalangium rubrum TaxID=3103134 RepID=A0ABU5H3L3_9BACT|nr:MarR family transcriptional regulator [Hyalangium sp. s54d21]MDY7227489.1 MarR family transcriptional regulator [Hyalangium sp. s54d21]
MSGTQGDRLESKQRAEAPRPEEDLARQAWAPLFEVIHEMMRHFPAIASEFELSPVQAHVLRTLAEGPQPMSVLADYLACDASNVTGLVDRLEARGLVERRSAEHDRRVKLLALTEAGWELRQRLIARLSQPPEAITGLAPADLRALRDVMLRAVRNLETRRAEARAAPTPPPAPAQREG